MTNIGKIVSIIIVLAVIFGIVFILQKPVNTENTEEPVVANYDKTLLVGNAEDLVEFSIYPNALMPQGILSYKGIIKGAWFFEGNILINILDVNGNLLKASNAVAKTDWMTEGAVEFEGNIDFTGLPAGPAYFEIHNDNASGEPQFDKFIQIPIVIQ